MATVATGSARIQYRRRRVNSGGKCAHHTGRTGNLGNSFPFDV
jgi:hypothetical protein